jgi:hypothetical protein
VTGKVSDLKALMPYDGKIDEMEVLINLYFA